MKKNLVSLSIGKESCKKCLKRAKKGKDGLCKKCSQFKYIDNIKYQKRKPSLTLRRKSNKINE